MKLESYRVAELQVSYHPLRNRKPVIRSAKDAFEHIFQFYNHQTISLQEQLLVMYLSTNGRVLGVFDLSKGGITSTVIDCRIILAVALKIASTRLIISHNHPSGNLKPSDSDFFITNKLKKGCEILDIQLDDHIIVVPEGKFYSFAEDGVLQLIK